MKIQQKFKADILLGKKRTKSSNLLFKKHFKTFLINRNTTNAQALNDAMHIAMVDFIGTMSYSLFKYAENAGMSNITHQYCKDIVKGSFYNTPAMPLINTGDNTAEELNNKNVHEQDNTANFQGDDC